MRSAEWLYPWTSVSSPSLVPCCQLQPEARGQGSPRDVAHRGQLPKAQRLTQNPRKWMEVPGVEANGSCCVSAGTLQGEWSQTQTGASSPTCIVCALALRMLRKLLKNPNSFFPPKKPEEKERTVSLGLANNLGLLTPSGCVNAQALMNNCFGLGAAEHRPGANFAPADE